VNKKPGRRRAIENVGVTGLLDLAARGKKNREKNNTEMERRGEERFRKSLERREKRGRSIFPTAAKARA